MNPKSTSTNPPPPQAFHVMLKPRGPICNLECSYCFYLRKDALYPNATFCMSDELLEEFTSQYIQAQNVPEITFAWQGGEPTLMGLDFFRKAVDYQRKYRQQGQKINNSLQTNAVLLNDEWVQFFKQNNFLLGVSLDGPRELHDTYRVDKGGQPTFERVMHGVRLLQKHRVEYNILACVNDRTAQYPLDVYHFLRDEVAATFIQFIPIVEKSSDPAHPISARSVTGSAYGHFLTVIFDEWVQSDVGKVFVQIFDVALAAWAGFRPGLCVHEATCGRALAMEHNGDLYSCDHFVDSKHFLGNMITQSLVELINLPQQRQFGRDKKAALPRLCRKCRVRFACNGGCPKDRLLATPDSEPGLNVLCEGYLAFFIHIDRPMHRMVELIQANRAPAGIMEQLQLHKTSNATEKPGRKRRKKSENEAPHV
jgi:uncharacterized protein